MTAIINGLEARRTFIDNGASVNIMPLSTLRHLGIPEKKLVKKQIDITGFTSNRARTLGSIQVDVQVGKLRGPVTFHVIDADTTYHAVLGRVW